MRSSHILFRVPPKGEPKDTLAVYKRAMNVIAQIPSELDTLAFKFSEDMSGKNKTMGISVYFTMDRMVPKLVMRVIAKALESIQKDPYALNTGIM